MHIEITKSAKPATQPWHWRFVNKGRITANAESFPSRGNAIRAAKGVVRAVCKQWNPLGPGGAVFFNTTVEDGVTVITWS